MAGSGRRGDGATGKGLVVRGGALRKGAGHPKPNANLSADGAGLKMGGNPFMPGLRIREDGWTAGRTRVFLAVLGKTGCVTDAARVAGVSTTSVNRSRRLFAPFDRACVAALAKALRGLEAVAYERAVEGRETVVYRGGKEVERRITPSDAMLRLLIQRGDLSGALGRVMTAEEAENFVLPEAVRPRFLSRKEFFSGIVFDKGRDSGKCQRPTSEETDTEILRRIAAIERTRSRQDSDAGKCRVCGGRIDDASRAVLEAKANQVVAPRAPVWEAPRRPVDE